MRLRTGYVLLFAVPSFLIASVGAVGVAGAAAGMFWLFIFGDNPWPAWSSGAIVAAGLCAGALLWAAQLWLAWTVGRQRELVPPRTYRTADIIVSLVATLVLVALIASRFGAAGRGPIADLDRCADYCRAEGFSASGMPPRNSGDHTCSCYDTSGKEARRITLPTAAPSGAR